MSKGCNTKHTFHKKIPLILLASAIIGLSPQTPQNTQTRTVKSDGTVVINTTEIGKDIRGFKGPTPVEITITKGKVSDIKTLPNYDTPDWFNRAKDVLKPFIGLSVSEGLEIEVDAVSGATFSSKGLIDHVKAGLKYEKENK